MTLVTDSPSVIYRHSWPRPATPCDLAPRWAGEFRSYEDWVSFATQRLTGTIDRLTGSELKAVCIDAAGRRCTMGAHMSRARDEGTYPIRYFFECEPAAPISDLEARCTAIADAAVPKYRDGKARSCTGHYARQWQAAWDGACLALGGKPEESRR